ncbi:YdeI/OmpD-associated family protein [Patiriisocius hiemis]|uniref:YdeI/OmpD-associated family protein n=1 Tax=Patiriisocius hiemis TaxID=3075604 RepID=A0ABU2Y9T2_9FLAO|nr:YdeI/OmpD-associated family protein [Constantimarinum sp. W242]MDT0554550.1 YdeI/OmpD-associated family protein [Constantimarinum sp. W242]
MERPQLYFPRAIEWREWLHSNHTKYQNGIYLEFYKLQTKVPTMRWEEAVKVALCYGWIDSTVKSLGGGKRRQLFTHRNPKSTWSTLNKKYIIALEKEGLIHESGWKLINLAKKSGKWSEMDDVENGIIPPDLQKAFSKNNKAFTNYNNFAPSYKKSYLSWLHSAKRQETRDKRIQEIITLCGLNKKSRS